MLLRNLTLNLNKKLYIKIYEYLCDWFKMVWAVKQEKKWWLSKDNILIMKKNKNREKS